MTDLRLGTHEMRFDPCLISSIEISYVEKFTRCESSQIHSASEAANILKKPDDTMRCVNRANEGRSKINEIIINGKSDVKLEKFGRLSLELPVSWYPLDDDEY
jgi:hypothetical protein